MDEKSSDQRPQGCWLACQAGMNDRPLILPPGNHHQGSMEEGLGASEKGRAGSLLVAGWTPLMHHTSPHLAAERRVLLRAFLLTTVPVPLDSTPETRSSEHPLEYLWLSLCLLHPGKGRLQL